MDLSKRKQSLMLLLVGLALVLLPLLAVLQYRWLGEVSQAERERMQANLRTSAERLCADFDRELTNVYVQLQSPALPNSDQFAADFASRYGRWLSTAPNPKLVRDIYRTWFDDADKLKLTRFNESSNSFEPVEWPEKLLPIRNRFESEQSAGATAQNFLREIFKPGAESKDLMIPKGVPAFVFQISPGLTADDIPALIIPDASESRADIHSLAAGKRTCTVAVLDADLIKNEILPSLIKRHFSADGVNEYNLAVVRRGDSHEAVYQSDVSLPLKTFEQSDARSSLFRIRAEELDRTLITAMKLPVPPQSPPDPVASGTGKSQSSRVAVRVLQSDVRVARSGDRVVEGQQQKIEIHRPFANPFDSEGGWQLLVKHRAGSLDAAVANVRRRNLAISFGILLLLGVSVGFIVMSSRRAERLAIQQMEFVAGVSHELRTPLAVICSAAENLADGVPGLIDNREQVKRYGGLIRDEGRRLTGMVEQVLEFAGAQSGRKTYELRPTDLNRVIEDALAASHLQLVEGGFELDKSVPAGLPTINADASALSRAIQNLLNNAMKYSGESRWIGLSVQTVKTDRGEEIQVKVSDRGLGIAPAELSHIFEPFYRGKEVVAGQIHGNGLGLSLVKHIVGEHGGRIDVESSAGQGSVFTLTLPSVTPQELTDKVIQGIYEQTHPAR